MVVEPSYTEEESANSSILSNISFGRPKGTTMIYSRDLKERIRLATKEAAPKYTDVREKAKLANKRAGRGKHTKIAADAKQKYGIIDANISIYKVRTRAKRNKLNPDVRQGTPSSMVVIEPYIIDLITQLSRMQALINVATGLQLANSLPRGNLLEWGYWRDFMKRNGHLIKSKKAVKFESKRADRCIYHNFSIMYREVYEEMVKGGIATKQPDEIQPMRSQPAVFQQNTQCSILKGLSLLTRLALTHQPLKMEAWLVRNFYVRQTQDHK